MVQTKKERKRHANCDVYSLCTLHIAVEQKGEKKDANCDV